MIEESISEMTQKDKPSFFILSAGGKMPDDLVKLCRMWGIIDE